MQSLRVTPVCTAPRAMRLSRRSLAAAPALQSARACQPAARRSRLVVRAASDGAAGGADGLLDVVIVGGGISGLCTAQALVTKHAAAARRVLVTESRDRVGGNITTVSVRPPRRVAAAVAPAGRSGAHADLLSQQLGSGAAADSAGSLLTLTCAGRAPAALSER
jgi:hypothetical protein